MIQHNDIFYEFNDDNINESIKIYKSLQDTHNIKALKNTQSLFDNAYCVDYSGYAKILKKILSCICLKCSKLLIKNDLNKLGCETVSASISGKTRMAEIYNLAKDVTYCYSCGMNTSKIKIDANKKMEKINIIAQFDLGENTKINYILHPDRCYDMLSKISNSDCLAIGLNPIASRPETIIHKIFQMVVYVSVTF